MKKKRLRTTILTPLIGLALLFVPVSAAIAQVNFTTEQLQSEVQSVYRDTHESVANITTKALTMGMFNMPTTQKGAGSGFLYDESGHVVTNFHVIRNAKTITVSLGQDQVYDAEVIGTDPLTDIAVLEIEGDSLPDPIPMGNSDELVVGEFVVALGNPFNFERTLTFGVISANTVENVVTALIRDGSYPHPWLGLRPLNLTPAFSRLLERANQDVPVDKGLLVVQVLDGGPADEAGLQGGQRQLRIENRRLLVGGDIIFGIDGREVGSYKDLIGYLENEVSIGETVRISYYRDGDRQSTRVEVGERPSRNQ